MSTGQSYSTMRNLSFAIYVLYETTACLYYMFGGFPTSTIMNTKLFLDSSHSNCDVFHSHALPRMFSIITIIGCEEALKHVQTDIIPLFFVSASRLTSLQQDKHIVWPQKQH